MWPFVLRAVVGAIEADGETVTIRCRDGNCFTGSASVLTVPLPLLSTITLPDQARATAAAAVSDIGFGNVIKILLRFSGNWWATHTRSRSRGHVFSVFRCRGSDVVDPIP